MTAASFSDWAAAFCAALSVCSATTIPFVAWVDADYLLVEDWQPVRDRLLVEVAEVKFEARDAATDAWALARLSARDAAVSAAGFLLFLRSFSREVTR